MIYAYRTQISEYPILYMNMHTNGCVGYMRRRLVVVV